MKNVLIKMSRRRSLMVPVVTLLAIGLGISGYYIQNRQIVAREQAEQEQAETANQQPGAVATPDPAEFETKDTVEESTKVTEDGEPTKVVDVELVIEEQSGNDEVVISAAINSTEPGVCAVYLKQGAYGPEQTVDVKDGVCEARVRNPGEGVWRAKVLYTSNDGYTRGDAQENVQL